VLIHCVLHDIGTDMAYDAAGRLTDRARSLGHELLGLELLRSALARIEHSGPHRADQMPDLVAGLWKAQRWRDDEPLAAALVARRSDMITPIAWGASLGIGAIFWVFALTIGYMARRGEKGSKKDYR